MEQKQIEKTLINLYSCYYKEYRKYRDNSDVCTRDFAEGILVEICQTLNKLTPDDYMCNGDYELIWRSKKWETLIPKKGEVRNDSQRESHHLQSGKHAQGENQ